MLRVKDEKPDAVCAFFAGGPGSINLIKQFTTTGLKATIRMIGGAVGAQQGALNVDRTMDVLRGADRRSAAD